MNNFHGKKIGYVPQEKMDSVTWIGMFLVVCPGITDLWAVGTSAWCGGMADKNKFALRTTPDRQITNKKPLSKCEQFATNTDLSLQGKLLFLPVQGTTKTGVINQRIDQFRSRYQEYSARKSTVISYRNKIYCIA